MCEGWTITRLLYPQTNAAQGEIQHTPKLSGAGLQIQAGDIIEMDICQSQLLIELGPQQNLIAVTSIENSTWVLRNHSVKIGAGCLPVHLEEVCNQLLFLYI